MTDHTRNSSSDPDDLDSFVELFAQCCNGDVDQAGHIISLLYASLHRCAQGLMNGQPNGHSLTATGLISESYERLRKCAATSNGGEHFLHAAAMAMQQVLQDRARRNARQRRPPKANRRLLEVETLEHLKDVTEPEIIELRDALCRLEEYGEDSALSARLLRSIFYCGLSLPKAAEVHGLTLHKAKKLYNFAKDWLRDELSR